MIKPISFSIYKFFGFIGILFILSLSSKLLSSYFVYSDGLFSTYLRIDPAKKRVFIIGSSRVNLGMDTSVLKNRIKDSRFIIIGLSSNSFLYNSRLAYKIIQKASPGDLVFFELSIAKLLPPNYYLFIYSSTDLVSVVKQYLYSMPLTLFYTGELIRYLFSINGLPGVIQQYINRDHPSFGFTSSTVRFQGNTESIITENDLNNLPKSNQKSDFEFNMILQNLIKMAASKKIRLIFVLPVTINRPVEKRIDLINFHSIPNENKWRYSSNFLTKINNVDYLSDPNHLNSFGAALYTHELADFILQLDK